MPNIPQQQTIVQYIANASQSQYTFAFYAPLPTDIQVFYQASNAVPIPSVDILTLNSQYTVTYNSDPTTGGYITLLFTPTTGYYLTINRQVAPTLNTNFALAQNFNGANLDSALDRLLLLIQQNFNYITQRNLSYVINTYLPNASPYTQLPPLPQNYVWIGSGSGIVAAQISTVPSASVLQSMLANNSSGTDGALLVGYYDAVTPAATTVHAFLANIVPFLNTNFINNQSYADAGAANAVSITIPASYVAYVANTFLNINIAHTNTTTTTVNVNGIRAIPLNLGNGNAINPGDIVANSIAQIVINGTTATLLNPQSGLSNKFYGAIVSASNTTIPPGNAPIQLLWGNVVSNTYGIYNAGTNAMTPTIPGVYLVSAFINLPATSNNNAPVQLLLYKNGSLNAILDMQILTTNGNVTLSGSTLVPMNGTDTLAIVGANFGTANVVLGGLGTSTSWSLSLQGQ